MPNESNEKSDVFSEKLKNSVFIVTNVISSVGIVLLNKSVFKTYNFNYGTFLTILHFLGTFFGLLVCSMLGLFEFKRIPIKKVITLSASFCGFVVLTNLSLQYNSVGFYQMAKVLTTPGVVFIQYFFYNKSVNIKTLLTITWICIGVMIASVSDVRLNFRGAVVALLGVMVTSYYQVSIGSKQKELEVNSMQLLLYQSPISSLMLLIVLPLFEDLNALVNYQWTLNSIYAILGTCMLAFFVNLSIFLIIGKMSALTYNIVGHFKLCTVVVLGMFLFDEPPTNRSLLGISMTIAGVFYYSTLKK
ncbi:TPT-domain-containing protein [Rozella allomycis CSF55]|uniref:TPT-domain-containing protein n=1 Tax=Rozella allomycis (strain CSF55) TaxID=988480 RepID=A0A4V1IZR7_ROZAC|nr:TPT-domain-containing protein [Rozella allomycis CSF55]